jgi:hypothetical protein
MPHKSIHKSPVTQPGHDPGTVRLVTQRLNHYATPGPCYGVPLRFHVQSDRHNHLSETLQILPPPQLVPYWACSIQYILLNPFT